MKERVVITGYDVMCSLGNGKKEVRDALRKQEVPLKKYGVVNEIKEFENTFVGRVMWGNDGLESYIGEDKSESMVRKTFNGALEDAGLDRQALEMESERVSMSLATSIMGAEHTIMYKKTGDVRYVGLSKQFGMRLAKEFRVGGEIYTTSSACASGSAAAGIAFDLVQSGRADVVICCGTDQISAISLYGFQTLGSMTEGKGKPFDKERDGINIGEGSACFVFESLTHAQARNAKIHAEVIGVGLSNDAWHITSPAPDGRGAIESMKMALKEGFGSLDELGKYNIYVNAHGTSTKANDEMELKAIRHVFENADSKCMVSSTKSLTGHCLGAAGSIELALGLLMGEDRVVYPTCNSNTDLDDNYNLNKRITPDYEPEFLLSNSFAFGGNDATILVKLNDFRINKRGAE